MKLGLLQRFNKRKADSRGNQKRRKITAHPHTHRRPECSQKTCDLVKMLPNSMGLCVVYHKEAFTRCSGTSFFFSLSVTLKSIVIGCLVFGMMTLAVVVVPSFASQFGGLYWLERATVHHSSNKSSPPIYLWGQRKVQEIGENVYAVPINIQIEGEMGVYPSGSSDDDNRVCVCVSESV